jgi:SAM-dependent methyltransferase
MSQGTVLRQVARYRPLKNDPYYDLNISLTSKLDSLKSSLENKKILEYGAGERPFEEFFKGMSVVAADISQNAQGTIDVILDKESNYLPFPDNAFDVIIIFDVLEHIKNDREICKEFNRVLTPGGLVIGNVPFLYRFHEEPYDYHRYTPSGLRFLFNEISSFTEEKIEPIGSHYFIARKCLEEISFNLPRMKSYYVRFLRYLLTFGNPKDISFNSPFSYFFIFKK